MSDALAVAAASWGVLMAISPLLQIRRILERRSAADVSIGYLLVLLVGWVVWIAYGVSIANAALIVPNAVALVVGVTTIAVAYRFREPAALAPAAPAAATPPQDAGRASARAGEADAA
ncbi:MAG TPA: SemiSWEET family transporter [Candidatus Limnocylindrales bacterium]